MQHGMADHYPTSLVLCTLHDMSAIISFGFNPSHVYLGPNAVFKPFVVTSSPPNRFVRFARSTWGRKDGLFHYDVFLTRGPLAHSRCGCGEDDHLTKS